MLQRIDNGKRQKDAAIVLKVKRTGDIVMVVTRRHPESYRSGCKSISEARKTKVETWGIDGHILNKCRVFSPKYVVIFLTDTNEYWVSNFSAWMNPAVRIRRTSRLRSDPIIHLPSHLMKHVPDKDRLRGSVV